MRKLVIKIFQNVLTLKPIDATIHNVFYHLLMIEFAHLVLIRIPVFLLNSFWPVVKTAGIFLSCGKLSAARWTGFRRGEECIDWRGSRGEKGKWISGGNSLYGISKQPQNLCRPRYGRRTGRSEGASADESTGDSSFCGF